MKTLPDIVREVQVEIGKERKNGKVIRHYVGCLTFTEAVDRIADATLRACVRNNPYYVPSLTRPEPWTDVYRYGEHGERQRLVSSNSPVILEAFREALQSDRRDWLDALHKLESVRYRINPHMLRVVKHDRELATFENQLGFKSLFVKQTRYGWKFIPEEKKRKKVLLARRGDWNKGAVNLFNAHMEVADELGNEAFHFPMYFDPRGRVYPLASFNFIQGNPIRCLFDFALGKRIGRRGLYWLAIHTANCAAGFGDYEPVRSTRKERVRWVNEHIRVLKEIGQNAIDPSKGDYVPISTNGARDRFQFIRACIELYRANGNPEFVTHLPLPWDASCNGIQHYCLMMRDEDGGRRVNLVPERRPRDLYQDVADAITDGNVVVRYRTHRPYEKTRYRERRPKILTPILVHPRVQSLFLSIGPSAARKITKGIGVPHYYGGSDLRDGVRNRIQQDKAQSVHRLSWKEWGMRDYLDNEVAEAVTSYLRAALPKPEYARRLVKRLAVLLAKENKSLRWITPTGFPWHSRYHLPDIKRPGRKRRFSVTVGDLPEVDIKASRKAAAPNFVHGLDAAHLQLVALGAGDIPLATIHDCFACLAPDAGKFRAMVHRRLSQMYMDHDPPAELLECVKKELSPDGQQRLPTLPKRENLKFIENASHAQYITS